MHGAQEARLSVGYFLLVVCYRAAGQRRLLLSMIDFGALFEQLISSFCWAITVNKNWRVTFSFENGDVYIVDYEDYH